ncbi:hypothetical protein DV515_00014558, partial [Chloebia gouldiae]
MKSNAYPEFVLTYLEELNEREEVTQTENHIHHGAWAAAHQEIDSSSAEEVTALSHRQVSDSPAKKKKTKKNVSNPNQKQLSGPLDAHLMPADPLGETAQLTVALVRKLEEKHPKAPAQRTVLVGLATGGDEDDDPCSSKVHLVHAEPLRFHMKGGKLVHSSKYCGGKSEKSQTDIVDMEDPSCREELAFRSPGKNNRVQK